MSGVRNLRAMFEQKGDPLPDRGRSPGPGGFGTPSPSASPRPLSKVRTSFVAVEKDGRIGLRREPSEDSVSVSSRRKLSNASDATTPQAIFDKSDPFSDKMTSTVASFKTNLSHEPIPESPRQDTPVKLSPKKDPKTSPNANPDKVIDEEEPQTKMLSGNPTELSAARLGGTVFNRGISDALSSTPSVTIKEQAPVTTKPAPKTVAPVQTVSTAKITTRASKSPLTAKAPNGKELTKATNGKEPTKVTNGKQPTKAPNAREPTKAPNAKEPTKAPNAKEPTKAPNVKEPTKAASSSANAKKTAVTKTAASKPAPISLTPASTGFVKPKPKSPTRPVKLPSSLTTHTASSAQKLGSGNTAPAPRQSLSRASGNVQHLSANPTTHRSPSRASVSTVGTTTTKTLKHKPSNVGRSRPSLGPPPKQETKDQPAAKRESQVDENFLARMMRPTQSSAKKTSEKVPVTPPRRQSAPVKRLETRDVERNVNKVAAKLQASSTHAKTTRGNVRPVAAKEQATAKEIAPAIAQVEAVETAIEGTKPSTDTAESPLVEDKGLEAEAAIEDAKLLSNIAESPVAGDEKIEAEPTANEFAAIVTQEEKAEGIIEAAKTSTDTLVTANVPSIKETEVTEVETVPGPSAEANVAGPSTPLSIVSEDLNEVEDSQDVVQEAQESNYPAQSTGSTVEVSQQEGVPQTDESTAVSTEEPNVDAQETVEEPLESEDTIADAEETVGEEVQTEGSTTVNSSLDGTTDGIEEATTKEAVATAP